MAQRDWILRVIEQLGAVLAELRRMLLGGGRLSEVDRARLEDAVSRVGLDPQVALAATAETLILLVAPTGEVDPTRAWVLAEALNIDAMDAELSEDFERARRSLEKAEALYRAVEPGSAFTGLTEASTRLEEVRERLLRLPSAGP